MNGNHPLYSMCEVEGLGQRRSGMGCSKSRCLPFSPAFFNGFLLGVDGPKHRKLPISHSSSFGPHPGPKTVLWGCQKGAFGCIRSYAHNENSVREPDLSHPVP